MLLIMYMIYTNCNPNTYKLVHLKHQNHCFDQSYTAYKIQAFTQTMIWNFPNKNSNMPNSEKLSSPLSKI
jgi:hypothetical protein